MTISIRYSLGFRAFILESGDLLTYFEDDDLYDGIKALADWLRRRAIRSALAEDHPEGVSPEELNDLKVKYLDQDGQVKGKIKHINLEDYDL